MKVIISNFDECIRRVADEFISKINRGLEAEKRWRTGARLLSLLFDNFDRTFFSYLYRI